MGGGADPLVRIGGYDAPEESNAPGRSGLASYGSWQTVEDRDSTFTTGRIRRRGHVGSHAANVRHSRSFTASCWIFVSALIRCARSALVSVAVN